MWQVLKNRDGWLGGLVFWISREKQWSEYVDGTWSPKQLTKEFIEYPAAKGVDEIRPDFPVERDLSAYTFCVMIDAETKELLIAPFIAGDQIGGFGLIDINTKVEMQKMQI